MLNRTSQLHLSTLLLAALWAFTLGTAPLYGQIDIITTVAGRGSILSDGDGFAATSAGVPSPHDVALDEAGNLYISTSGRIRRVNAAGIIETFAQVPLPTIAGFAVPSQTFTTGITFNNGSIFVSQNSSLGSRVIMVDAQGAASVFLDRGTLGFNLGAFVDLVMDQSGNLFVSDSAHDQVIRRSAAGAVSIYAGRTDVNAFSGDGGPATAASLNTPTGLAIDGAGNLYIADSRNHRVRRVDSAGKISTIAGSGGPGGGFSGDGGPATLARLSSPRGLVVDGDNNLYIGDSGNSRIRRIDRSGIITTVAGSGSRSGCFGLECYSGDDGPAIAAQLSASVEGLAADRAGNLYIADSGNDRVRKVTFNTSASELLPPNIRTSGGLGVVNGASYQSEIASGTWVSIFGEHLAPILAPGRTWRGSEIVDGKLPTSLDGVSVRFNGKPGYMYFIHPEQLNVLAPDGLPTGVIEVEVETPSGVAVTNALVQPVAPALFITGVGRLGVYYAAAVHPDGTVVGDPTVRPGTRPARTGDHISLYGTGFGPTSPSRPAGEIFDPAPLSIPYTIRVNGDRVSSNFGGIVGPGLYQFNIVMPKVSGPFALVEIEVLDQRTDPRMILAVQ